MLTAPKVTVNSRPTFISAAMHSAAIAVSLLLLASAVVAIQVAETAASEHSGANNVEPPQTDVSNLSDEEVAAEVKALSNQGLEEKWRMYGQYCGQS